MIVVTTKKGHAGSNKIAYTGEYSVRLKPSYNRFNILNSQEQMGVYKEMEQAGYTFEAADASFELLLAEEMEGRRPSYFDVESWRVIAESLGGDAAAEATVKVRAGGERFAVIGEGNGPVNALDHALRQAIERVYPDVTQFRLTDFRVRILDQGKGTDAITRVLIETADAKDSWVTVGVGANIIEASWEALVDAFTYGLRLHGVSAQPA